jgi:tetratricopeptide (TPR) repeat protein
VDPVAQDEYLRGLYFSNKGGEPNLRMAITHFNKAIETDPTYAPAYAELAISYFWLGNPQTGGPSAKETLPQAKVAVTKALQLDPLLARAHLALGLITLASEWNWAGAEDQYRTAMKLNPNCGECLHQYSALLTGLGRNDEAIAQIKHEIELEPLNVVPRYWLAVIAFMLRQYDSSIRQLEVLYNGDAIIGLSYAQEKKYPEAIASLQNCRTESAPCRALDLAFLAQVYGFAGQKRDAQKIIDELKERARHHYIFPSVFANAYLGIDKDQALTWFERAYEEQDPWLFYLKVWPTLDPLRPEPRFQALMRRVNFPQ